MRTPTRLVALSIAFSAALAGCIDEAAQGQRDAARKLKEVSNASAKAIAEVSAIDPAANRAGAESLRKVAASATAPQGAMPSQKAALSLIASQLQIQAARLDAAAIEQIEAPQRTAADEAVTLASLAGQFEALQHSIVVAIPPEARQMLDKDRAAGEATIAALSAQSDKLHGIVEQAQQTIQNHEREALELEKKAGELRQKASIAGPIEGYQVTVESQKSMTESRSLRSQAANLELDMQEVALQQRLAEKTVDAFKSSLKRNRVEQDTLAKIESVRENAVKGLAEVASRYRDAALAAAKSVRDAQEKAAPLYDGAIEGLEKAVSLAQQGAAGGGEIAKSAKSAQVSAQLALASIAERRACAEALAIAAYSAAAKLDASGPWSKDAATSRASRSAVIAKASAAIEAALGGIPEGGGDDNAAKFRKGLELAKASLSEGQPAPAPAEAPGDAKPAGADKDAAPAPADAPTTPSGDQPAAPVPGDAPTPPADPAPPAAPPAAPSR
jgi:hypothetical protein